MCVCARISIFDQYRHAYVMTQNISINELYVYELDGVRPFGSSYFSRVENPRNIPCVYPRIVEIVRPIRLRYWYRNGLGVVTEAVLTRPV